jgi:hypothetical protein
LILDGMDQNHCRVPYLGGLNRFSDPVTQLITGLFIRFLLMTLIYEYYYCFQESKNMALVLRFIEILTTYVSKGCNITIYCLLRQLESFHKRHGCYPETLYLQVDGGSENANQYVLALLELLVVKRCCREIYFTRLPEYISQRY